jgi:2-oxo-4-hydroxy-4-carboxy-5-ureidoimidazoline decarboxylase
MINKTTRATVKDVDVKAIEALAKANGVDAGGPVMINKSTRATVKDVDVKAIEALSANGQFQPEGRTASKGKDNLLQAPKPVITGINRSCRSTVKTGAGEAAKLTEQLQAIQEADRRSSKGSMLELSEVNEMDAEEFEEAFGEIYEESSWVAAAVAEQLPFKSLRALADALKAAVDVSDEEDKVALLKAYPQFKDESVIAGKSDRDGRRRSSILSELAIAQAEYTDKFGWPFMVTCRNLTARSFLGALKRRCNSDMCQERVESIEQVHKAAWMRLLRKVRFSPVGKLSCQVQDTTRGVPASGMHVTLRRQTAPVSEDFPLGKWDNVSHFVTDDEGRIAALKGPKMLPGTYEWNFKAGEYFLVVGTSTADVPFLDEVPVRFGIDEPESIYNMSLHISPWSFSVSKA